MGKFKHTFQHLDDATIPIIFDGMRVGDLGMTDIDVTFELHDILRELFEVKHKNAPEKTGQTTVINRYIDDFTAAGKRGVGFIVEYDKLYKARTESGRIIDVVRLDECIVRRIRDGKYDDKFRDAITNTTTAWDVHRYFVYHTLKEEEGMDDRLIYAIYPQLKPGFIPVVEIKLAS